METDYKADKKIVYDKLSKMLLKFYLNFTRKTATTNSNNLEATFADEMASLDGPVKMTFDLALTFGSDPFYQPLFRMFHDLIWGYLKHDLIQKKDEHLPWSFDEYVNVRRYTFVSEALYRTLLFFSCQNTSENEKLLKVPDFKRFCQLFELLIFLPNDIRSFNLEQSRDDHWANGVTILAREKGVLLQDGLQLVIEKLDDAITEFQILGWRLAHDLDLNQRFLHLIHLVEVTLPNFAYDPIKACDSYKLDPGAKTDVDSNPVIGTRIDSAALYKRVK